MKKLFSFLVLLALTIQVFAQKNDSTTKYSQEQIEKFRRNARWQLNTALAMTAVGTVMMISALFIADNSTNGSADNAAGIMFVTGVGLDLGSLGFSIPSHGNRMKAKRASMALSSQRLPANMVTGGLALKSQPAITLSIPLGH